MNIPSFCRKGNKLSTQNVNKKTLDIQHSKKLQQIQEYDAKQNEIKECIRHLNNQIDELVELKNTQGLSDEQFNEYLKCIDRRDDLHKELDKLNEKTDEVDYYVNVGSTLFRYYDILEKGINDEETINKIDVNDNSILKFFIKTNDNNPDEQKKDIKDDRASLLEKYLSFIDDNYITNYQVETKDCCQYCGSNNMKMLINDGLNYCNDCSSVEYVTIEHERPSYHQVSYEISYFAYKRINHLNELYICLTFYF